MKFWKILEDSGGYYVSIYLIDTTPRPDYIPSRDERLTRPF
jgi:hypothetical protein